MKSGAARSLLVAAYAAVMLAFVTAEDSTPQVLKERIHGASKNPCVLSHDGELLYWSNTDSYYINNATNHTRDSLFGEIQKDLGGFIPFSAYDYDLDHLHVWYQLYGPGPLRQVMFQNITDLRKLDAALQQHWPGAPSLLDTTDPAYIYTESDWHWTAEPWWSTGGKILVDVWKLHINGGKVLIMRRQFNTVQEEPDEVHLYLYNSTMHYSDFGSSPPKNDFEKGCFPYAVPQTPWPWDTNGNPVLYQGEQALDRGDIVIHVLENFSSDLWQALLRTQDAEFYVTKIWIDDHFPDRTWDIGRAYIDGFSWGALVSGVFSLLQSAVYSGCHHIFQTDVGYHMLGVGDWNLLRSHRWAGYGSGDFERAHSNAQMKDLQLLVDMLGIRFDDPKDGMKPWDVAAFSINHRDPSEFKMPVKGGYIGAEDTACNWHWQYDDKVSRTNLGTNFVQNLAHGFYPNGKGKPHAGYDDGINEAHFSTTKEWNELITTTSGVQPDNPALVPGYDPPDHPYPDPYSHTLRHTPCADEKGAVGLLTEAMVNTDTADGNIVRSLGQGVLPGYYDSLDVGDLDGDGDQEVFFGNLDGFFHVLEPYYDPDRDDLVLRNEWKSPPLGYGLWAMVVRWGENSRKVWLGDCTGRIHVINAPGGAGIYEALPDPIAGPGVNSNLYAGPIPFLYRGNFDTGNSGKEIIALNTHLDYVILDRNGAQLDVVKRSIKALGPGKGTVAEVDPDAPGDELIIPALDGHVWVLKRDIHDVSEGDWLIEELMGFTNYALYHAETFQYLNSTYLLLLGRNEDKPDGYVNHLLIRKLDDPSYAFDFGIGVGLKNPCIAWQTGTANPTFLLGGVTGKLRKVQLVLVPGNEHAIISPSKKVQGSITGLAWLKPGGDLDQGYFVSAHCNGRIYLITEDLQVARNSEDAWQNDSDVGFADGDQGATYEPLDWYSNRSLGHTLSCHVRQTSGQGGVMEPIAYEFLAAEFMLPFYEVNNSPRYRVAKLDLVAGLPPQDDWDELQSFSAKTRQGTGQVTRFFQYEDVDEDGDPEPYFQAEAGTVFRDDNGDVHQFCNRKTMDGSFPANPSMWEFGGYVFEWLPNPGDVFASGRYVVLDGFIIPDDPAPSPYFHNGTADWFLPKVGPNRITGQIANATQSVKIGWCDGTSMTSALLKDPQSPEEPAKRHVVAGTMGGYVYAILPGSNPPHVPMQGLASLESSLSYASPDLGWNVLSLDAGKIGPDDEEDTIVAGTWIDDGSFYDWKDITCYKKNRGHLLLLRPDGANPGRLKVEADLNADDLMMGIRQGIGSGVAGVKLDDVDGDGTKEIWCGDAIGYMYLFYRDGSNDWHCAYRSSNLGAYPGINGNIYPVKDHQGRTVELVVVGSGYVNRFEVDCTVLP